MPTFQYSIGNRKIGKDTLIFNMGSATDCPSASKGLCDLLKSGKCYAYKSENLYKEVLPYRREQEKYWLSTDPFTIAEDIARVFARRKRDPLRYVRVNESGDFHTSGCVKKLIQIAETLPEISFYTYTHRKDLIRSGMKFPKNLIINCSNFHRKGMNCYSIEPRVRVKSLKAEFLRARQQIRDLRGRLSATCPGDCTKCTLCKVPHGNTVWVPLH